MPRKPRENAAKTPAQPRRTAVVAVEPDEDDDDAAEVETVEADPLDSMIAELAEDSRAYTVSLYRFNEEPRVNSWEFVGTLHNQFSPELVRDHFGGGRYKATFRRDGQYAAQHIFRIARSSMPPGAGTGLGPSPSPTPFPPAFNSGAPAPVDALLARLDKLEAALTRPAGDSRTDKLFDALLAKFIGGGGDGGTGQIIDAIRTGAELSGKGRGGSGVGELIEGLRALDELRGGDDGDESPRGAPGGGSGGAAVQASEYASVIEAIGKAAPSIVSALKAWGIGPDAVRKPVRNTAAKPAAQNKTSDESGGPAASAVTADKAAAASEVTQRDGVGGRSRPAPEADAAADPTPALAPGKDEAVVFLAGIARAMKRGAVEGTDPATYAEVLLDADPSIGDMVVQLDNDAVIGAVKSICPSLDDVPAAYLGGVIDAIRAMLTDDDGDDESAPPAAHNGTEGELASEGERPDVAGKIGGGG